MFIEHGLVFEKGCRRNVTENNSKPDILFPSFSAYHEQEYPQDKLVFLAAKTTCKDRWRQVLAEAARIPKKYLITLQPLISTNQLEKMRYHQLQLVIPSPILSLYSPDSQDFLMPLYEFIDVVKDTTLAFSKMKMHMWVHLRFLLSVGIYRRLYAKTRHS